MERALLLDKSSWYFREPTGLFTNLDKTAITADPNNALNAIGVFAAFNQVLDITPLPNPISRAMAQILGQPPRLCMTPFPI